MPFVPVPLTAHCVVHQRLDGQEVLNDLYFRHFGSPFSILDLGALAQGLYDYWVANMLPFQSAQLTAERVSARDLTTQFGAVVESSGGPDAGSGSNDFLPNNVSIVVSFRTGLAGRSFRGRNYFAGLTEQQVTDNEVEPGDLASILLAYNGIVGVGTIATGWEWGVVSRISGGLDRAEGVFTPILTAISVDPIIDSQRRRLPKRGR